MLRTVSVVLVLLAAGLAHHGVQAGEPPAAELFKLHAADARAYRLFADEKHSQSFQLVEKPVFTWTNLALEQVQLGHLFVWTDAGRPAAIGTFFSNKSWGNTTKRDVMHEFHTLSPGRIYPVTPSSFKTAWEPQAGIDLQPVPGAPPVGESASQRLLQLRNIARGFVAETQDGNGKIWQLRLLTTPLLRYSQEKGEVLDGALFAMVSSAGTDPEVLLLVEARQTPSEKAKWTWHSAAVRFSDKDITVKFKEQPLWSSLTDEHHKLIIKGDYSVMHVPDKTYMCYRAHSIDELPEALATPEK